MSGRRLTILLGVVACALAGGCSGGSPAGDAAATSSAGGTLHLVSLGDSDATGIGDEEGTGWVQRYADLVADETGSDVEVVAHAEEGLSSDGLLADLKNDQALQDDVAASDVVVIGAGGADLNAGDDAWAAGTCAGTDCYRPLLAAYAENIDGVAARVAELRAGRPTVFRAMSTPNALTGAEDVIPSFLAASATEVGAFQALSLRDSTCAAVRQHGGECADVVTAFNGPDGTQDAYAAGLLNHDDCCYPNAQGQQKIAELLLETGTQPRALS